MEIFLLILGAVPKALGSSMCQLGSSTLIATVSSSICQTTLTEPIPEKLIGLALKIINIY